MRSVITARISVLCVPHRHASGLTLVPYLEPGRQVALPQWSVTAPLVTDTTRTDRQQQGRAPNQDKRRLGARPAAAAVAGPEDEGATLYWLVNVNETLRWGGVRALLMLACRWSWVLGLACKQTWRGDQEWRTVMPLDACCIQWPVPMTLPCPMAFRIMPGS